MSLEKKLILTALLVGLKYSNFRKRIIAILKGQEDAPIAGLTPTPASVQTDLDDLDDIVANGEALKLQQIANTEAYNAKTKKIRNEITDEWMPKVQTACAGDVEKAKGWGFGVKDVYNGHSQSPVSVTNSYPLVTDIDYNNHLQQTIYLVNNTTEDVNIPDDAESLQAYETFDQANTTDVKKMMHLGRVKHGKITNHFHSEELGKEVWYVFVYVPKDENVSPILSTPVKATII